MIEALIFISGFCIGTLYGPKMLGMTVGEAWKALKQKVTKRTP